VLQRVHKYLGELEAFATRITKNLDFSRDGDATTF